jgi:hypothetical protein
MLIHTLKGMLLGATFFVVACTPTEQGNTTGSYAVQPSASDPMAALSQREALYAEVFEQAERQGMLIGGLRGALLGALVQGEGGAVAGGVLGAIIGSSYSVSVAERLLQERGEFLNRQEIIENILEASTLAASRSIEDAELVTRALSAQTLSADAIDNMTHMQFAQSVATVRRAVELRALLVEEALLEASLPDAEEEQVRQEIARQIDALRRIRKQEEIWNGVSHG